MKKNFISILITNYNKDKFLFECLKSASSQKFKNFEIILFDDASNDNSKIIYKKFRNIKIITNKKKKRLSAPLNQIYGIYEAFKKSKGNLICLMDADDYFKKEKLKIINKKFENEKNLNLLLNLPQIFNKNFILKKKIFFKSTWPKIFPTSCITLSRSSFKKFFKYVKFNDFPNLEIDARITIFYYFYFKEYKILNKELTIYNYDENGITAKIKKFSKIWWLRRVEAFEYLKLILRKKNERFYPNVDYIVTVVFSSLIKFISK